jgi:hypothetical protein
MKKSTLKNLKELSDEIFEELTESIGEYLNTSDFDYEDAQEAYDYIRKQIKKRL